MMIPLLLALCFLPGESSESFAVQDMSAAWVVKTRVVDKTCLMLAVSGISPSLYSFDFETERFKQIKDGRIQLHNMDICHAGGGFALFARPVFGEGSIYLLDQQGQFQDSLRIGEFTGSKPNGDMLHVCNGPSGKILATLGSAEQNTRVTLYELDLAGKSFKELQTFETDRQDAASYWVASNEELCFVSPYSGRIRTVGADYLPGRTVNPARPLVESESSGAKLPKDAKVPKQALFLRYKPQIGSIYELQTSISLTLMEHTDEKIDKFVLGRSVQVSKVNKTPLSYRQGRLQKTNGTLIAACGKKSLYYDEEEQGFEIRRQ